MRAAATAAALTAGAAVFAAGLPHAVGPVWLVNESAAMAPAYPAGGRLLVDRDAYREGRRPRAGDVVAVTPTPAIRAACGSTGYPLPDPVLRIAGVPGDRVAVRGGLLYRNGARVRITGEHRDTSRYDRDFGVVPDGAVLLLGDDRPESCDARLWAPRGEPFTPLAAVAGRVVTRPAPVTP
ncbi:MAG: signal peptidase I [Thermoleophilia bacterium]|nr:signal peptidase I [Thermoleophilia bacterium]